MSAYRLLRRNDYDELVAQVPLAVQRKATWAQVLLGTRGRTPTVKSTTGLNAAWRRTPVQGSHYYLWWIPAADTALHFNGGAAGPVHVDGARAAAPLPAILVHSIRHHDETDRPLEVGATSDYEQVEVGLLDPRFEEQSEIGLAADAPGVTFNLIEGMPGSGKSVALIYLARDLTLRPAMGKVRYITYTERLKRSAREIFDGLGPEIARHITVHTLNDVVRDLLADKKGGALGMPALASTPYAELRSFGRDLEAFNPRDVGPWRDYPLTLYTELRAEVVGRTLPQGYTLPRHRDEQLRRRGSQTDVARYARMRGLELRAAETAIALAEKLRGRYFTDQVLAGQALDKVLKGTLPAWLAHTDAIIVDEVQDLTLLQIALIGEMARMRRLALPDRPFTLTVAGDESQIVQPTGFKWGVAKDLLAEAVDTHPVRHEFGEQRRSPPLLARLIDASWGFYAKLPKELRPSARQGAPLAAQPLVGGVPDAEPGLAILLPPPPEHEAGAAWRALLEEVAARPGRAVIDLTETLSLSLTAGDTTGADGEGFSEVLFAAREIKGLERATILVHGLGQVYDRVIALAENEDGTIIPQMEARRLIDQMRVALSRSTSRIIFVESPDAAVFDALEFDAKAAAIALGWSELAEFLQADMMTELELVSGLLDEAEELADRSRLDDALRRNRRAAAIAERAGSLDAVAQARRQFAILTLRHAEALLETGALAQAQEAFQELTAAADALPDEQYTARMNELEERLTAASDSLFDKLLDQSRDALDALEYPAAHAAAARALAIAARAATADRMARARRAAIKATAAWAADLAAIGLAADSTQIHSLLTELAGLHLSAGAAAQAAATRVLARRYAETPQRGGLATAQIEAVLAIARLVLAEHAPDATTLQHLSVWLDETFNALGNKGDIYYAWANTAARLAAFDKAPDFDERLWDLENRLLLAPPDALAGREVASFRAFLADYGGDPAQASLSWEQLGDMELAIESARNAGDLERAYMLLRRTNASHVPESISTAVKALRLLQQLHQKQQHLYPAERRALLEELARLHAVLEKDNA